MLINYHRNIIKLFVIFVIVFFNSAIIQNLRVRFRWLNWWINPISISFKPVCWLAITTHLCLASFLRAFPFIGLIATSSYFNWNLSHKSEQHNWLDITEQNIYRVKWVKWHNTKLHKARNMHHFVWRLL